MSIASATSSTITAAPFLKDAAIKAVIAALGGQARFVGGCVRNVLLGVPVSDVDLATPLLPEDVMAALKSAGLRSAPTGLAHGTVTALTDAGPIEITTLRRDVETDGRHAVVAFTTEWAEDAARRDFTVNALYADLNGQVFDYFSGLTDLAERRIRFVGDPHGRIREDYLRILRFFRMHAAYGAGAPDPEGLKACGVHAQGLDRLAGERVQKEMMRLLAADGALAALRAMAASGVLGHIFPGRADFVRFERVIACDEHHFFQPDPELRLIALCGEGEEQARTIATRWRLSNAARDRIVAALSPQALRIVSYLSIREVRRALYLLGHPLYRDLVRLRWAEDPKGSTTMQWRALLALGESWQRPELPLSGVEVMAAGVPAGPEVGRVLKEVEAWWIDSDFIDDRFSIIERLKAVVQATIY